MPDYQDNDAESPGTMGCPQIVPGSDVIKKCNDHIVIDDTFAIMRVPYYEKRFKENSANLPSFWGFVPRWYIPHVSLYVNQVDYPVTLTVIIVNT